ADLVHAITPSLNFHTRKYKSNLPTCRSAGCLSQSQQAAGYAQPFLDQKIMICAVICPLSGGTFALNMSSNAKQVLEVWRWNRLVEPGVR
ncbi:MAG: hypothetical protein ACKO7W_20285, partial [Elainella sp.]